jgi:hypothetical protein
MQLVHNSLSLLWVFSLLSQSVIKQDFASLCSDISDTFSTFVAHLDQKRIVFFGNSLNFGFIILRYVGILLQIAFSQHNH